MIRILSILMLVLCIDTHMQVNAAEDDLGLGENKLTFKKRKLEEGAKPEVAIDMSSSFRKDVVTKLDLSGNDHLIDINFVLGFPELKSLNLYGCENLKNNYYPVSQLTNLRILDMRGIGIITTTEPLKPLINLTSLDICRSKKFLKYIIPLPSLRDLRIRGDTTGENYLDKLGQLTSLEKLNLNGMFNNVRDEPGYECPSLDFLSRLTNLTTLNLGCNDYIFSIKPIVRLPNLTNLNISFCKSICDLRKLSKLKSLVKLNMEWIDQTNVPTIKEDLNHLKKLKNLRVLIVSLSLDVPKFPQNVKIYKK